MAVSRGVQARSIPTSGARPQHRALLGPGCIPALAASTATALISLPGIYLIRAAIFPCFPRSLRCIQAAKRAIRMETRCPDEGISNYFLADKSHLSASHLFARKPARCPASRLHLPSPAGKCSPGIVQGRAGDCLCRCPAVARHVCC